MFWLKFGARIGRAEIESTAAVLAGKDAIDRVTRLDASFSTYREQVARDYIQRDAMRELEDRLTAAIDRLGDRLDRFVEAAVHR